MTQQQQWKEAALAKSEAISDAWDVTKVYAGRLAEWVLFGCMITNIVEVVMTVPPVVANAVLAVQAVTLDIAGFGLASMASEARRLGNAQAAKQAQVTATLLIGLMILTLLLVTVGVLWPAAKPSTDLAEKVLLVGRVVMTVIYGHIVHSLRDAKQAYTTELARVQEERDRAEQQVASGQAEVARLRAHLDTKGKEVDSLRGQVASGQEEVPTLRTQLDTLRGQVDSGQAEVDTLRRQLQSALAEVEKVRAEGREKQHELEGGQVGSGQASRVSSEQAHVDSGHLLHSVSRRGVQVDSGQVIALDRKQRERGQQEAEQVLGEHIKALLSQQPELSNRAIATKLACSPTTVGKWRKSLTSASVNEEARLAQSRRNSTC